MYEHFFGFRGRPFQLNPDPSFFYNSRGHSSAYAYLKFGAYQGEGFIVVTGEIGAGKTTLVRALLQELDAQRVIAAQIVSTQLDEDDLLRSVATAFGLSLKSSSKAELIATLEAFFTLLMSRGQRALLVVDEAQNLSQRALEELRLLSNFQLGDVALLQSFLIGQPELRQKLRLPSMEQLRQRVIASYHLGPMNEAETIGYIEHRLRHVGWSGDPAISPEAFRPIFLWSGGLPRKINLLANRVLLAAYLAERHTIDEPDVDAVIDELARETGLSGVAPAPIAPSSSSSAVRDEDHTAGVNVVSLDSGRSMLPAPVGVHEAPGVDASKSPAAALSSRHFRTRPIVVVLDEPTSYIKLAPLLRALAAKKASPPVVTVQTDLSYDFALGAQMVADLEMPSPDVNLEVTETSAIVHMTEVMRRFEPLFAECRPGAVMIAGQSDAALGCALVASRMNVKIVQLDAGLRDGRFDTREERNRILLDRLANLLFTTSTSETLNLQREGLAADRVHEVGSLLVDSLIERKTFAAAPEQTLRAAGVPTDAVHAESGYALVTIHREDNLKSREGLTNVLLALRAVGVHVPMLWPMDAQTRTHIEQFGLARALDDLRIACLPPQGYFEALGLIAHARLVLTDAGSIQEEASVLNVPCITLGTTTERPATVEFGTNHLVDFDSSRIASVVKSILKSGGRKGRELAAWDGRSASRIADVLIEWFARAGAGTPRRARA